MNQSVNKQKIFGIGLNKTGTTTLGTCGKILGYSCISYDRDLIEDVKLRNDFTRIKTVVSRYDLFEDFPWPLIYQDLDIMFPGSKFILTVRKDEETWLNSLKMHSMRTHPTRHLRKLTYGYSYPEGNEKEYLECYRRHNDNVRSYFKNRKNDFIEICWEKDQGWNELCTFLKKDIPNIPFPHSQKGSEQNPKDERFLINQALSKSGD